MKHILLAILLSSALFSYNKQIILGNYVEKSNAVNELKLLNSHIDTDISLNELAVKNSLKGELKKIENYYVVSILTFDSYVQLLRTLESLQRYYPDAYVIEAPTAIVEPIDKIEKIDIKVKVVVPQAPMIEKDKPSAKIVSPVPISQDKDNKNKEYLEYLLVLAAIAGLGFMIYKRKKQAKEV